MRIVILTEGGKNIGFGHLSRCVALAQGVRKADAAAKIEFIVNGDRKASKFLVKHRIKPYVLNWIKDKEKVLYFTGNADSVLIDSYLAPRSFYSFIDRPKSRIIAIDDYNRIDYPVDIVVNPSFYGEKLNYKKSGRSPTYLTGKDYIILRKEFWKVPAKAVKTTVRDVLITFGGIGNAGFMRQLLKYMSTEFPGFIYHIIATGDIGCRSQRNFKSYSYISALSMRDLMLRCDLCISAGGQTLYELCRVGLPTTGICFTENQRFNLENLSNGGIIEYIGWFKDDGVFNRLGSAIRRLIPREERVDRYRKAKSTVDGKGVERLIKYVAAK